MGRGKGFQKTGDPSELICGDGIGDDQDSLMRAEVIEELNGQPDEIISISGYQASSLLRCELQLFSIGRLDHPGLVGAVGVDSVLSEDLRDPWAEVLVQIVFHQREREWELIKA